MILEQENFDNLLEIQPTSLYEIYITKIKNGSVKNSGDDCKPESGT